MFRLLFVSIVFLSISTSAQVLPLREQSRVIDEILADRFNNLLPVLMEKNGVDMWVIVSREYNEDPVLRTMLPSTWISARRRTILVFYYNAEKKVMEKLAIARYNVGDNIKAAWDLQKHPNQWDALMDIITTRNPKKIGINTSVNYGHADGMDVTDYNESGECRNAGSKLAGNKNREGDELLSEAHQYHS
jgi:hypothetical protein